MLAALDVRRSFVGELSLRWRDVDLERRLAPGGGGEDRRRWRRKVKIRGALRDELLAGPWAPAGRAAGRLRVRDARAEARLSHDNFRARVLGQARQRCTQGEKIPGNGTVAVGHTNTRSGSGRACRRCRGS